MTTSWTATTHGIYGTGGVVLNEGNAVKMDGNGNIITFTGERLLKYGRAGNLIWTRTIGVLPMVLPKPLYGLPQDMAVDRVGNIFLGAPDTGQAWETDKYDTNGILVWSRSNHPNEALQWAVATDTKGDVYGGGQGNLGLDWKLCIEKYRGTDGGLVWTRTGLGFPDGTIVYGLAIDSSDNVVAVGTFGDVARTAMMVIKLDSNGKLVWSRSYFGVDAHYYESHSVAVGPEGQIFVAGLHSTNNNDPFAVISNAMVWFYDSAGNLLWDKQVRRWYGIRGLFTGFDGCGNAYILAEDRNIGYFHVNSYDSNGGVRWEWATTDPGGNPDMMVKGMGVSGGGSVILAGSTLVDNSDWLIQAVYPECRAGEKLKEPGTVKIVGGVRGYINPKRGESATILLKPTGAGEIRVRIYDEEGILVKEIVQSTSGGHTETIQWHAVDSGGNPVPAGLYPILIEGPGIKYRDKLVVIR